MFARTVHRIARRTMASHGHKKEAPVLGMEKVDFSASKMDRAYLPGDYVREPAQSAWSFNRGRATPCVKEIEGWTAAYEQNLPTEVAPTPVQVLPRLVVGITAGIFAGRCWYSNAESALRCEFQRLPEDRKVAVAKWYQALVKPYGDEKYDAIVAKKISQLEAEAAKVAH